MTIQEGLKYKEFPYWISGTKRADLPKFLKERGAKKGVEIGVSWGENIVDYCEAGLEIYGIDPWKDSRNNHYKKIISLDRKHRQTIDDVYNYAVERTKDYPNCHLIKKLSTDALDDFPDRSLDFVYIDGNHGFGYVAMDLQQWSQKVKKGGIIAGHDYLDTIKSRNYRHVRYIIKAYAEAYDYQNWYILGKPEDKEHDRALSYLFIKHW